MTKFLVVTLAVFSLYSPAQAEEKIVLSCANSARDSVVDAAAAAFSKETGIKISFVEGGRRMSTSEYFKDLLDGKAEGACASATYEDWLKTMEKDKVAIPANAGISQRVIGKDLMYVIAHKAAGVASLTLAQVESVFTGDVKNWKQVGGADLAIGVVSAKDRVNSRNTFARMAMSRRDFRSDFLELERVGEMLKHIENTPGSVTVFSESVKTPNSVTVKTPDIGRPVTLLTKGRPTPAMDKFIQFARKLNAVN